MPAASALVLQLLDAPLVDLPQLIGSVGTATLGLACHLMQRRERVSEVPPLDVALPYPVIIDTAPPVFAVASPALIATRPPAEIFPLPT